MLPYTHPFPLATAILQLLTLPGASGSGGLGAAPLSASLLRQKSSTGAALTKPGWVGAQGARREPQT